jgi:hypothetical protein
MVFSTLLFKTQSEGVDQISSVFCSRADCKARSHRCYKGELVPKRVEKFETPNKTVVDGHIGNF